jgi:hypothetical protein
MLHIPEGEHLLYCHNEPQILTRYTRIANVNRYLHLLCGYAVYYVHIHVANIRHMRSYLKKMNKTLKYPPQPED